jgi:DNA-binding CsgD family transcriptional regulator
MAAGAESSSNDDRDPDRVVQPLAPLNRDEVDWAEVYRVYCKLPPCERKVLDLLVGRCDTKQIARRLQVSPATVRNQIASVKQKLDVDSLSELVGLITIALYEEARRT